MFRTNLVVHHQEHGIIYCITQFGTIGTVVLSGESRVGRYRSFRSNSESLFNALYPEVFQVEFTAYNLLFVLR